MLSWLMSEPRKTAEGQVEPSSPLTSPRGAKNSEEVEVIDIDIDAAESSAVESPVQEKTVGEETASPKPIDIDVSESPAVESPARERTEEEEAASPKLRRSKRKAAYHPYVATKVARVARVARVWNMSACKRTPPPLSLIHI